VPKVRATLSIAIDVTSVPPYQRVR
jgi:hypothetical protein